MVLWDDGLPCSSQNDAEIPEINQATQRRDILIIIMMMINDDDSLDFSLIPRNPPMHYSSHLPRRIFQKAMPVTPCMSLAKTTKLPLMHLPTTPYYVKELSPEQLTGGAQGLSIAHTRASQLKIIYSLYYIDLYQCTRYAFLL